MRSNEDQTQPKIKYLKKKNAGQTMREADLEDEKAERLVRGSYYNNLKRVSFRPLQYQKLLSTC